MLGDAGDLRGATQATLRGYYKRHYVPENMTLVVVGPVNPAEVRAAAVAAFGAIPRAGYHATGRCRRRHRSTACARDPWSARSDRRSSASRGWRRHSAIPTCRRWTC